MRGPPLHEDRDMREVVLSAQLTDGQWVNAETISRVPRQDLWPRLLAAEALLYLTILAAALVVASRIARPLRPAKRRGRATLAQLRR